MIESIKEIERNRQLLLKQQGSHVIEHERQKMHELKKKSHDEARAQYMQQSQTSAAMAAAAVAAAAMPNGSSGDAVDERDRYESFDGIGTANIPVESVRLAHRGFVIIASWQNKQYGIAQTNTHTLTSRFLIVYSRVRVCGILLMCVVISGSVFIPKPTAR